MGWTPIASVVTALGANGGDTDDIDIYGATFVGVMAGWYYGITTDVTIADTLTSSWNMLTAQIDGTEAKGCLFWAPVTGGGAGYHVTLGGVSTFSAAAVYAFSGANAVPFDQQSGANAVQPGVLTPSADMALILCGVAARGGIAPTVTGMDAYISVGYGGGVNEAVGLGYAIQTTATAINPTWDPIDPATVMAIFFSQPDAPPPAMGGRVHRIVTRPAAYRPGIAR